MAQFSLTVHDQVLSALIDLVRLEAARDLSDMKILGSYCDEFESNGLEFHQFGNNWPEGNPKMFYVEFKVDGMGEPVLHGYATNQFDFTRHEKPFTGIPARIWEERQMLGLAREIVRHLTT